MTTITEYGWMEAPWMVGDWMVPLVTASTGMQATLAVDDESPNAMQSELVIDTTKAMGSQSLLEIIDGKKTTAMQAKLVIDDTKTTAMQANLIVDDVRAMAMQIINEIDNAVKTTAMQSTLVISDQNTLGMQIINQIADTPKTSGMQIITGIDDGSSSSGMSVNQVRHTHKSCQGGWMEDPWMAGEWMTDKPCVFVGMQVDAGISNTEALGMQVTNIIDTTKTMGMQALLEIIDGSLAVGMQVEGAGGKATGMQVRVALYNDRNLRILCKFLSRGTSGNNWTATTTETGDFDPSNVNTDLVEQVWRSIDTGSQILACDAQNPVLVDTIGLFNHNISRGGTIQVQASNESDYSVIGLDVSIGWTSENLFWISPELPTTAYRYWRFIFNDITNPDGYLQIGTIVFGSSEVFQGECFVDDIEFGYLDFTDVVETEGFTNIANSRALKKTLGLQFRFINSFKGNYEIIRNLITTYRTTHKCLWIPTPSSENEETTARYALFSKLTDLPRETHTSPSNDIDYASFDINLDESK